MASVAVERRGKTVSIQVAVQARGAVKIQVLEIR